MSAIEPFADTKGQRREQRQRIRNGLGNSRGPAPSLAQVLRAVLALDRLLWLTTAGKFRLRIEREDGTLVDRNRTWTALKDEGVVR